MQYKFNITIETDDAPEGPNPVYLRVRGPGKFARTEEIVDGEVFADYDYEGRLIGVEMLCPGDAVVKDKIIAGAQ